MSESPDAWAKRTGKRVWEHPNWWGWNLLRCVGCGRMTSRPPRSSRQCDWCGGALVARTIEAGDITTEAA